jgi:hypothetical protein
LVPVLTSNALDGYDIYNGWMMQETPRKYTTPTYIKHDLRGDPKLAETMIYRMA